MSWNDSLAHKMTADYWSSEKGERFALVLLDRQIKHYGFRNPELSEDLLRNEMRIEAGELLKYFVELSIERHGGDEVLDEAFLELVEILTVGEEKLSRTGDLVDRIFKFVDE